MECKYFGFMFVSSQCANCLECDKINKCIEEYEKTGNWKVVSYEFEEGKGKCVVY